MTAPSKSTQESTLLACSYISASIHATARRCLCYLLLFWWLLRQIIISAMDCYHNYYDSYCSSSRFLSSRANLLVRTSTPTPETAALCAAMWLILIDAVLGIVFGIYRFLRGVLDNCPKIVRRKQATAMVILPSLFGFSKSSSYGTSFSLMPWSPAGPACT
jgi:hypothetical protein